MMYPYWLLSIFFMVMALADIKLTSFKFGCIEKKQSYYLKCYLFLLSILVLVIFSGVRGDGSGMDDWQYKLSFLDIDKQAMTMSLSKIIPQYKFEPLTTFIMYISSMLTNSANVFLLIYAFLSVSINAWTYKKFTPYFLLAISIYSSHLFLNKDMNQIRFGLSSALFIYSACLYSNKKIVYSLVFMALAILAHQTAIAGLSIYALGFLPKKKYLPIAIFIISIILGGIGGKILFGHLFIYLPQTVSDYEGTKFDTDMNIVSFANLKNLIFIVIFTLYKNTDKVHDQVATISGSKKENPKENIYYFLILTYTLGASLRVIFHDFSIIGGRVGNLFLHVEPLLISLFAYKVRDKKILFSMFVLFVIAYYIYYNTISNPQSLMGYNVAGYFRFF